MHDRTLVDRTQRSDGVDRCRPRARSGTKVGFGRGPILRWTRRRDCLVVCSHRV
ncbi:hypothetical protein KPATCC21470_8288 [Kitasatospora purpeofusca]